MISQVQYLNILFYSLIIIILYMHSEIRQDSNHFSLKNAAQTPQTADSEPLHHDNFYQKCLSLDNQFYCFQKAPEINFNKTNSLPLQTNLKEEIQIKNQDQNFHELSSQYQQFTFGIQIFSKENRQNKINKFVQKVKENDEGVTMYIFKDQFECLMVPDNIQTEVQISLITQEGFQRVLLNQKIQKNVLLEQDLFKVYNIQKCIELYLIVEKRKNIVIKPLSIKLSPSYIEQILDQKLKLLNKSDLLNQVNSLELLKGILYPLSKQNMGSRIIQKLLLKASQGEKILAFNELKPYFNEMVGDKYGNYVFQKLFSLCPPAQRMIAIQSISAKAPELIKSKTGTYTFQCILKEIKVDELMQLSSALKQNFINLCLDQFGNHFIKELINKNYNIELYNQILLNFGVLANNKFGTVVLKAFLKIGRNQSHFKQQLLYCAQMNFNQIAVDQYGHYILEEFFKYYNYLELTPILEHLEKYIVYFSQSQYSSSIIKKALQMYSDYVGVPIIKELLNEGLESLMETNTGSFILHRLFDYVHNFEWKNLLQNKMKGAAAGLNCYQKRIKWSKYFNLC